MSVDWDRELLSPLQAEFGEAVNYQPAHGAAFDISGIFDRPYTQEVEPLDADDPGINTTHAVLGVRDGEFIAAGQTLPQQGDRLYVPSVSTLFVVADVQPDSHGGRKLVLNRVKT
ncbi:head-tail joining protein [Pantoea agglomerans]|uniref:head-tail joining protein n=1 Tax=Enterobacter agglomerans TaxID=549 RepID=UPI002B1DDC38|nr:hypothetical protein [Pantoea agglomerans]